MRIVPAFHTVSTLYMAKAERALTRIPLTVHQEHHQSISLTRVAEIPIADGVASYSPSALRSIDQSLQRLLKPPSASVGAIVNISV